MSKRSSAIATLSAVGLAALLLSGCSLLPKVPVLNDGASPTDNGESIEENPFVDDALPDTFPTDIPVPDDLDILFALDLGTGWSVVYQADDIELDYGIAREKFEAEGWQTTLDEATDQGQFGLFENDEYQVQVAGAFESSDYDGPILSYTVVIKG